MRNYETRYQSFFENSADAMLIIENGVFVDCNAAAVTMLGYDRKEELIDTPPHQLSPEFQPDGRSSFDKAVEMMQLAQESGCHRFEWDHLRKNGTVLPVAVSLAAIEVENGIQLHTIWHDISKRKLAEEKLLEIKKRYREIFENLQEVYYESTMDGTILEVSPSVERLSQYTREKLIGKSFLDFYADPAEREDLVQRVLAEGRVKDYKIHLKDKEGLQRLCSLTVMLKRDSQGTPVKLIGSIRDISDSERIEELLRIQLKESETSQRLLKESEERFRALHDASYGGIMIHDKGLILDCNQGLSDMTGFTHEELIGTDGLKLIDPGSLELVLHNIKTGYDQRYEVTGVRKNGSIFPLSIRGKNITYRGRNARVIEFRDISEIKSAEKERESLIVQLQDKTAEQERFIYTVSHDLKSPLVTISGFAGIIAQELMAGNFTGCKEYLAVISTAAQRMKLLLDDLLELSRIGVVKHPPEVVNLGSLITAAKENVSGLLTEFNVTIEVAPDLPDVMVDKQHFLQVFENLIANAVRYSNPAADSPAININVNRGDGELICYVRDNGIGIEPDFFDKIFNLFERLDPSSEGTGVGLAIVKRIIQAHGGRIWIESEGLGHGSTFCFTVPEAIG